MFAFLAFFICVLSFEIRIEFVCLADAMNSASIALQLVCRAISSARLCISLYSIRFMAGIILFKWFMTASLGLYLVRTPLNSMMNIFGS